MNKEWQQQQANARRKCLESPETADKTTAGSADGARYGFCPHALVSTGIYSLECVTRNCRLATRPPRGQELSSTSLQRLSATKPLPLELPCHGWRGMHCRRTVQPSAGTYQVYLQCWPPVACTSELSIVRTERWKGPFPRDPWIVVSARADSPHSSGT